MLVKTMRKYDLDGNQLIIKKKNHESTNQGGVRAHLLLWPRLALHYLTIKTMHIPSETEHRPISGERGSGGQNRIRT